MKSKLKRALIDLSAGFLWLAAFFCLCFYAINEFNVSAWAAFLCGAAGLVFNYYLSVFFHEAGHVLFGRRAGLKPIKINYGFFTVYYPDNACGGEEKKQKKQKKNVRLSLLFGEAGESSFAPNKPIYSDSIKTVAFGGLAFSFIYCLAAFSVILLVKNAWLFCFFGAGSCSAFYIFSINVIPLDKTNDGSLVLFNGYCGELAKMLEFSRVLSAGGTVDELKEIGVSCGDCDRGDNCDNRDSEAEGGAYSAYISYFITATYDAEQAAGKLLENSRVKSLNGLCDGELYAVLGELIFSASVLRDNDFLSENAILIENYFCNDADLCGTKGLAFIRAHAAYRIFLKNAEWSTALINAYKKLLGEAYDSGEPSLSLKAESNLFALLNDKI